ncbi:MAG: peptide chain release factor-like protein [Candidatus Peregrinibacteria bacterium]
MNLPPQSNLTDKKYQEILQLIGQLGVNLKDIEENFVRGSGHGGQKRNKTSNTVQLRHAPTGTMVRYGKERGLGLNRLLALRELLDKLNPNSKRQAAIEKIRKQKARRARRGSEMSQV